MYIAILDRQIRSEDIVGASTKKIQILSKSQLTVSK